MIATIESTTVRRGGVPDRHEAGATPDIGGITRGGDVDVLRQGVIGRGRQRHQLQLMGVVDAGAVLHGQHG